MMAGLTSLSIVITGKMSSTWADVIEKIFITYKYHIQGGRELKPKYVAG